MQNSDFLAQPALSRPDVTPDDAARIAAERFGLEGRITELGSNQDRNFRIDTGTDRYVLKFAAYDKVPFYLQKTSADNAFHVVTVINNKQIVINRVYLRIEGGTFWVPNVKYIEVKGWNAATREPVVERLSV